MFSVTVCSREERDDRHQRNWATAFVIASIRALENENPEPLFSDPYAAWFSNERARGAARQLDVAFPPSTTMVRFRTRYFNRFVEYGIAGGARQVVLLGGGFDMRAHRYGGSDAAFFEVDQKTVLEFKRVVLERGGLAQPPSLLTNYLEADVPGGLAEFCFDPHAPTLIMWEGNTMYLPPESIMPFLNRLADAMSSFRMAFDYFALDLQNRESADPEDRRRLENMERAMERPPWTWWSERRPRCLMHSGPRAARRLQRRARQPFRTQHLGCFLLRKYHAIP